MKWLKMFNLMVLLEEAQNWKFKKKKQNKKKNKNNKQIKKMNKINQKIF